MARAVALVVAGVVVVQLAAAGLYVRYWIPLLSVAELPLVLGLAHFVSVRRLRGIVIAGAAFGGLYVARRELGSVGDDMKGALATVSGLQEQRVFLLRHMPLFAIYEHANHNLPVDARILLSTYCAGFYLDRTTYCAELVQDALRLTAWDPFISDVRHLGVTHVLAPRRLAADVGSTLPVVPGGGSVSEIFRAQQNEFVGRVLADSGQLLFSAADQGLYELQVPPK
jgi:hypothetical protein